MAPNLFAMNHELLWEDPDIFVVRVPYAHLGLAHTNCYVIRSGSDAVIIDPGTNSPTARQSFMRAMDDIGVDLQHARFLCTHLHFDHVALLRPLSGEGTHILISHTAAEAKPWNHYAERKAAMQAYLRKEGGTFLATRSLATITSEVRAYGLPGRVYELLDEGSEVHVGPHAFRVIETPGHSQGHICLYNEREQILFSGDHILENTTPGIAAPIERTDTFAEYLASVAKVRDLACRAVLPGHGEAFFTLAERCDELVEHHGQRLVQMYEVVAANPGANGSSLARRMPWKKAGPFKKWDRLNPYLRLSMVSQSLAYLAYLVHLGEVECSEVEGHNSYSVV